MESIIGETGEPIKLLMSDGSKQVQLNFDIGEGGDELGDAERQRRRRREVHTMAFNSHSL